MTARTHGTVTIPRPLLIGAGLLMLLTIVLAGVVSREKAERAARPVVAEQVRDLRFEDGNDGSVQVFDAQSGLTVAALPPGTHGFVRGTMRGLARERRQHNEGSRLAFRLTSWSNGQLTLDDLATGRRIVLSSFGPVNANDFAKLLQAQPQAQPPSVAAMNSNSL